MPIIYDSPPGPPGTVVAGYTGTYSAHTPYLTFDEWDTAATSVDTNDLVIGGTAAQQQAAVQNAIIRASSWVDRICHQVLAATNDQHRGRYLVTRWGTVKVPLANKPVLEVSNVNVGQTPSTMALVSSTGLGDVDISLYGVVEIPVGSAFSGAYGSRVGPGSRVRVTLDYVNGFPNTALAGPATAGASSLTVRSSLGIYPGTPLTVYDVMSGTEQVVVGSSFVAGSTTVPLVTPLAFAHAASISVSNLPPVVKEAAILLTTTLIQTRGNDAIVLDSMDPSQTASTSSGAKEAERLACALLGDLVRVR